MRILHVIQPPRGGAVAALLLLAREQATRHHVGVVCHSSGNAATVARSLGANVWTIAIDRAVRPRADLGHLGELRRIVSRFAPDVIHLHSSKAGVLGRLAAVTQGIPVVYSPHNFAYRSYEGSRLARQVFHTVERVLAPATDYLHVVSADEYDDALANRMVATSRCGMIHNGIDLDPLLALDEPSYSNVPIVGTFARLYPQKRVELLLDAFAILAERQVDFRGLVIGEGPERQRLIARSTANGLQDFVAFDAAPHDAAAALRRLDVYALPSSHDACPLALMEAMAAGRPVVATAVGAVPQLLATEAGLVRSGRPSDFADALQMLIESPSARRRAAADGRAKARRRFGPEMMASRVERLYDAAIARRISSGSARRNRTVM